MTEREKQESITALRKEAAETWVNANCIGMVKRSEELEEKANALERDIQRRS